MHARCGLYSWGSDILLPTAGVQMFCGLQLGIQRLWFCYLQLGTRHTRTARCSLQLGLRYSAAYGWGSNADYSWGSRERFCYLQLGTGHIRAARCSLQLGLRYSAAYGWGSNVLLITVGDTKIGSAIYS